MSTFSGNALPLLILALLLLGIFSGLPLLVGATLQLLCRFLAVVDCRLYVLLKLPGRDAEPFGAAVAHLVLPINLCQTSKPPRLGDHARFVFYLDVLREFALLDVERFGAVAQLGLPIISRQPRKPLRFGDHAPRFLIIRILWKRHDIGLVAHFRSLLRRRRRCCC